MAYFTKPTINVKQTFTLDVDNLGEHLWSGARDRWNDADDDTREAVFERILDWFDNLDDEDEIEITKINDAIWFDCADLFFPEEDEEEDDEEDDEEDEEEDEEEYCAGECEATPVMDTIMDGMALLSIFAMFAIVFF